MPEDFEDELFASAEERRAYEEFCESQDGAPGFHLGAPALVCRWRMAGKTVPMLNRHMRALASRSVSGTPLSANMVAWVKQHIEWSLAEGDYPERDDVLMLVVDVNGNAAMSVGPYAPLPDTTESALADRARCARVEQGETGVAPEVLAAVLNGTLYLCAGADEVLCGAATLVEQLVRTKGADVVRIDPAASDLQSAGGVLAGADAFMSEILRAARISFEGEGGAASESAAERDVAGAPAILLISDEHGVVVADAGGARGDEDPADREFAERIASGVRKIFR